MGEKACGGDCIIQYWLMVKVKFYQSKDSGCVELSASEGNAHMEVFVANSCSASARACLISGLRRVDFEGLFYWMGIIIGGTIAGTRAVPAPGTPEPHARRSWR